MSINYDIANMSLTEQERILLNELKSSGDQVAQDMVLMDILNSTGSRLTIDNVNSLNQNNLNQFKPNIRQSLENYNFSLKPTSTNQYFLSDFESTILKSSEPIDLNISEEVTVNGERGLLANKSEITNWKGSLPLSEYKINDDPNPEIVRKKTNQSIVYNQEVAIRYLRPPTPPPPGPILIQEEPNLALPPAPPIVIRQQPARPLTPPPLVIREAPPPPPPQIGKKIITISGKKIPPPPRKVIIERLPPLPSKPQSVIIERWLPYRQVKRKVIFTRSDGKESVILKPKNVIVEWQPPQIRIQKEFKDLGIVKANPLEYVQRYGSSLKRSGELPNFVKEIKPPSGLILAADSPSVSIYELEGDVHALNLVDLEREGLVEYKYSLKNTNLLSVENKSNSNPINELFRSMNLDLNETVSLSEAEKIMSRIYTRMGKRFGEEEIKSFFREVDIDYEGRIRVNDMKLSIEKAFK